MEMATKERPIKEIRLGRIKAVIWENKGERGSRFNVQLRRIYKDEEKWEQTDSFWPEDLLLVAKVSDEAHTWILSQGQEEA